jgi:hypothetical protein
MENVFASEVVTICVLRNSIEIEDKFCKLVHCVDTIITKLTYILPDVCIMASFVILLGTCVQLSHCRAVLRRPCGEPAHCPFRVAYQICLR